MTVNLNVHCRENLTCDSKDIPQEDLKYGLVFKGEDDGVNIIDNWCKVNCYPMTKIRQRKPGLDKSGEKDKGQRGYKYAHGVKRESKSKDERRPFQRVKFVGCKY